MWRSGTFASSRSERDALIGFTACLLVLAALASCHGDAFVKGVVPSEEGFDGAVRVVEESAEGEFGVVTVEIPYLDVHGNPKTGQGRLIVRRGELESGAPIPVFCHVHYEKDVRGAKTWCKRGWAVATAHYKESGRGYPIDVSVGDGYNLAHALILWVRRLPFIDRAHLHIDGASQGGYMALAMSADFFPVAATTADAPVVNWAYNLNYFEVNKPVSKFPQSDIQNSPLPILCAVTGLADASYAVFGNDLRSETWYRLSPIACVNRITNPMLIICATGDMLVPMEQMTRTHLRPYDKSRFPEGYQRDFDALTICEPARKTFEELLPPGAVFIHEMPLQENSFEVTLGMFKGKEKKPRKRPSEVDRPWSDQRQWSLCYLDEGGPAPYASHASYEWSTSPDSFVEAHRKVAPAPETLNAAKLDHLLRRYLGQIKDPPLLADGRPANRLNFAALEKRDVLTGLLDYAALGEGCAARLKSLYLQGDLHPFGPALDPDVLRNELARLAPVPAIPGKGSS
jgi:hypothetical protein